ncbi:hypothetical protein AVEN_250500-1 [Araneus ventricosus]|uniref:Uncharacterized protein n=1 Tax=Araneus ventricosus TaxID=182803 RepID=A0A4Y2FHL5_ARAVE|nr:hypothetical protein AVEN_250500-1 [Araneus ventricosus]
MITPLSDEISTHQNRQSVRIFSPPRTHPAPSLPDPTEVAFCIFCYRFPLPPFETEKMFFTTGIRLNIEYQSKHLIISPYDLKLFSLCLFSSQQQYSTAVSPPYSCENNNDWL